MDWETLKRDVKSRHQNEIAEKDEARSRLIAAREVEALRLRPEFEKALIDCLKKLPDSEFLWRPDSRRRRVVKRNFVWIYVSEFDGVDNHLLLSKDGTASLSLEERPKGIDGIEELVRHNITWDVPFGALVQFPKGMRNSMKAMASHLAQKGLL